ncbi:uncharacterized protein EURHEDRAFT_411844 [Aspergillus ruber CBS 135680]|uniref:Uncharacterized protein n=1 Tax=Aspergillus ruber (strain CBS 135680) TaxID=1388766 RepID=A0A017SH24_ASPRC|nr:uncharacterized protein EURHEDRAFT_411844 [Aspergillus ruber CBS 135680]EYE95565.1 hypothetical protein EURHEDRAFT_411844 [Aspergillus ruber CBS 135680]
MWLGINHIGKLDILEAYPHARIEVFKTETIKNSFAAAGLVPYNCERVIQSSIFSFVCQHPPEAGVAIGRLKRLRISSNYKSKHPQLRLY